MKDLIKVIPNHKRDKKVAKLCQTFLNRIFERDKEIYEIRTQTQMKMFIYGILPE